MTGLLAWLDTPVEDRGIRFLLPDGNWDFWSYARLAALSRRIAGGLIESGVQPGDVVALIERTGSNFVGGFFGALLAGATVAPLAPPMRFQGEDAYATVFKAIRPAVAICHPDALSRITETGVRALATETLEGRAAPPRSPAPIAMVQFTSGTSGRVRGVRLPHRALTASTDAIRAWLEMTEADATASWLPLHHDMGLVGCLLTPMTTSSDLWLMSPEDFVRRPLRYLECFGRLGARLTAMPGFGLDHITQRVRPDALAGLDFSEWRAAITGAERLSPASLEAFVELCAPFGLARSTLLPAYGLAEATLAVTGLPLRTGWRVARSPGGVPAIGCGFPLPGMEVSVVDGEIVVAGPSVADGYVPGVTAGSSRIDEGVVHTGDAGFLVDGELFVVGRRGDSVKIRGRSVFAEDLDSVLTAKLGVAVGRVATILGNDEDRCTAVVVFERGQAEWLDAVAGILRPYVEGARVLAVDVPRGSVPRTTSGKPRRKLLWEGYLRGEFGR